MGEADFSVADLVTAEKRVFNIYKGKGIFGKLEFVSVKQWNKYTFIDYVYGGLTTSLYLAVDFSLGNKSWKDPMSLHYVH